MIFRKQQIMTRWCASFLLPETLTYFLCFPLQLPKTNWSNRGRNNVIYPYIFIFITFSGYLGSFCNLIFFLGNGKIDFIEFVNLMEKMTKPHEENASTMEAFRWVGSNAFITWPYKPYKPWSLSIFGWNLALSIILWYR